MPTGYTADVESGKVRDFAMFAIRCARAMGATILMRDDPLDAPIPEEFKVSDYYYERLAETESELLRLRKLTPEQISNECATANLERELRWKQRQTERAGKCARYTAMLEKVKAWQPPTPDHEGMKKFMESQLVESMQFDCGYSENLTPPQSPVEWHQAAIQEYERAAKNARENLAEEIFRINERNKWLKQLRASVAEHSKKVDGA